MNKTIYQDNKIIKFLVQSKKYGDKEVIIDTEDYNKISKYKWCITFVRNKPVAVVTSLKGKTVYLHNLIANDIMIDHINTNPLNNCKYNLRKCNKMQNGQNRGLNKNNISGYKGVSWSKSKKKWRAYINIQYKQIFLGYFNDILEAAHAYNDAAKKYHGEFANLNMILYE